MAGKSTIGEKRLEELKKECIASAKRPCVAPPLPAQPCPTPSQPCPTPSQPCVAPPSPAQPRCRCVAVHEQRQQQLAVMHDQQCKDSNMC
ncbi:hypothetical protein QJQ45_030237, partial [Haematococcus lacustris]